MVHGFSLRDPEFLLLPASLSTLRDADLGPKDPPVRNRSPNKPTILDVGQMFSVRREFMT
jgi:hypothetical protein